MSKPSGSLTLTRRPGEAFKIGDDIFITVKEFNGSTQVRLTINAPKDVAIVRTELVERSMPR